MSDNINRNDMLRVGTILHGTYRIDGYLSSGGFGNTYVVTNIQLGGKRAVKEFFMRGVSQRDDNNTTISVSNAENEATFASQREKFKKEARRLYLLNNEHIVHVYDLFDENGTAYYVMDYVDGENLRDRLKRTGAPMSEAEVTRMLPQMLDALQAAHSFAGPDGEKGGILHLDLKPANIMVDSRGVVKLIDFGASKQQSAQGGATTSSAISYTQGYAPREQMEQNLDKFGPWTDFYALGATLYNLLTNRKPPMPSDIDEDGTPDKHLALPMPATISDKTRRLVLWLMKTNRYDRPQSVEDLRNFLSNDGGGMAASAGNREAGEDEGKTLLKTDRNDEDETLVAARKNPVGNEDDDEEEDSGSDMPDAVAPVSGKGGGGKKIAIGIVAAAAIFAVIFFFARNTGPSTDEVVSNLVSNMVPVEGGTFTMGATPEQGSEIALDEKPTHQVTLSGFSIGRYEVTQREWKAVMGSNPSYIKGDDHPVDCVSWDDCQAFILKLNQLTGKHFRLPTEAEWEFAARGGNRSQGYKYAGSNDIGSVAWYNDYNGNLQTHAVGTKQPNELGLYDMSGNVVEWCQDWYGPYSASPQTNPRGASSGSSRVNRGGCCYNEPEDCRVSGRSSTRPSLNDSIEGLGFRLAL